MRKEAPSTSDQVIDSRDVIERIEELESEKEALTDAVETAQEAWEETRAALDDARDDARHAHEGETQAVLDEAVKDERKAFDDATKVLDDAKAALLEWEQGDEGQELKALLALQDEAEGYAPDWRYGEALIREDYFVEYCQELVSDIGDLPRGIPNYLVIDWDKTADNLKVDYTEVDFDGTTYLVR